MRALGLSVDFIATSSRWGVEKPSPRFFAQIADTAALPPHQIVYVGDRLDNDVLPAKACGMRACLSAGPWGHLHAQRAEVGQADARIGSPAELPSVVAGFRVARPDTRAQA